MIDLPMLDPSTFPDSWWVHPVVSEAGGYDDRGNPLPRKERQLPPCLIGPASSADPADQSAVVEGGVSLYSYERLGLENRDVIVVPDGEHMAGRWLVDGRPNTWPKGDEVRLVRG